MKDGAQCNTNGNCINSQFNNNKLYQECSIHQSRSDPIPGVFNAKNFFGISTVSSIKWDFTDRSNAQCRVNFLCSMQCQWSKTLAQPNIYITVLLNALYGSHWPAGKDRHQDFSFRLILTFPWIEKHKVFSPKKEQKIDISKYLLPIWF
jgi:hypothetical protein